MEKNLDFFRVLNDLKKHKLFFAIFQAIGARLHEESNAVAYCDKNKNIYLNFEKIDYIAENFAPDSITKNDFRLFVLCHEIMHLYFSHFNQVRENSRIDNIAKDFVINHFLMGELGMRCLENMTEGVINYRTLGNKSLHLSMDSCQVYKILLADDGDLDDYSHDGFCSTKVEDLVESSSGKKLLEEKLTKALDQEDLKPLIEVEKSMLGNTQDKKLIASGQAGIARKIEWEKSGKSSSEIARILLTKALNNSRKLSTYKKAPRRDDSDLVSGKKQLKINRVCFIVDISGSISNDDLKVIFEVIDSSLRIVPRIVIRTIDDKLVKNEEITRANKNTKLNRSFFSGGGGGTDLNDALISGDNFLHYLIFTDGYIPELKKTKIKRTIFLFTKSNTEVEGEKNHVLK